MERVEVCDGWAVEFAAPVLRIVEGETVRFESHQWNPNMSDPREDALEWAHAVASEDSGLTVEYEDDPEFGAAVRYVRANAPRHFADECTFLAEDRRVEMGLSDD